MLNLPSYLWKVWEAPIWILNTVEGSITWCLQRQGQGTVVVSPSPKLELKPPRSSGSRRATGSCTLNPRDTTRGRLFCFKLIPWKERMQTWLTGVVLYRQIQINSVLTTDHPHPVAVSTHQNKCSETLQNEADSPEGAGYGRSGTGRSSTANIPPPSCVCGAEPQEECRDCCGLYHVTSFHFDFYS